MNHPLQKLTAMFLVFLATSLASGQVAADMITTLFAANNRQAGNMFNINVLAPNGINIESFDLNLLPGTFDVNLYTLDASYVGNENNPAAWTLHDSITGLTSAGTNNPTNWDFTDLTIGAGIQAFYVQVSSPTLAYTNGTAEGSIVSDNGIVQIFEGTGNAGSFGTVFRPRVWNGTIHYTVVIPEPQGVGALIGLILCLCGTRRRRR